MTKSIWPIFFTLIALIPSCTSVKLHPLSSSANDTYKKAPNTATPTVLITDNVEFERSKSLYTAASIPAAEKALPSLNGLLGSSIGAGSSMPSGEMTLTNTNKEFRVFEMTQEGLQEAAKDNRHLINDSGRVLFIVSEKANNNIVDSFVMRRANGEYKVSEIGYLSEHLPIIQGIYEEEIAATPEIEVSILDVPTLHVRFVLIKKDGQYYGRSIQDVKEVSILVGDKLTLNEISDRLKLLPVSKVE